MRDREVRVLHEVRATGERPLETLTVDAPPAY